MLLQWVLPLWLSPQIAQSQPNMEPAVFDHSATFAHCRPRIQGVACQVQKVVQSESTLALVKNTHRLRHLGRAGPQTKHLELVQVFAASPIVQQLVTFLLCAQPLCLVNYNLQTSFKNARDSISHAPCAHFGRNDHFTKRSSQEMQQRVKHRPHTHLHTRSICPHMFIQEH